MNMVAHRPGAVEGGLLRGAKPIKGIKLIRANQPGKPDRMLLNGPAKLTQGLNMTSLTIRITTSHPTKGLDFTNEENTANRYFHWHRPALASTDVQKTPFIPIHKDGCSS